MSYLGCLIYHYRTEAFDRTLPGRWSRYDSLVWIPFDTAASSANARRLARDLGAPGSPINRSTEGWHDAERLSQPERAETIRRLERDR